MGKPILADQIFAETGCHLKDLPGAMTDRDRRWERERERIKRICAVNHLNDDDDNMVIKIWLNYQLNL